MKTTRTGLTAERPALRQRYAEARVEGEGHEEARRAVAKGLPFHLVDEWTEDLCATFGGSDAYAQDLAVVSTVLRNEGTITRRHYDEEHDRRWEPGF